jgi:xanthine dehydrogenase accessory factor
LERLAAAGVGREDLDRLRGPVGLDLGGRAPAETALAIMSEIVAMRYGGSGRPMKERANAGGEREGASVPHAPVPAG